MNLYLAAETLSVILGFFILFMSVIIVMGWMENERVEDRISVVNAQRKGLSTATPLRRSGAALLQSLGARLARTRLFKTVNLDSIRSALNDAGIRDQNAYTILLGIKLLGAVVAPFLFFFAGFFLGYHGTTLYLFPFAGFVLGMLVPEWSLRAIKSRYQASLRNALPDALDLLVICLDAGIALESTLARVAQEMRLHYPVLSRELQATNYDLQINPDVNRALDALAARTKVSEIERLCATMSQSAQYGMPLAMSLRNLSREMRAKSLAAFEERASKLSTKITIPMILFIVPALFLIVLAPAIPLLVHAISDLKLHQ